MWSGAETWMESSSSASGGSTLRSARTTNLGGLFEFEFSSTELSAVPISGFTVTGRDSDIFSFLSIPFHEAHMYKLRKNKRPCSGLVG